MPKPGLQIRTSTKTEVPFLLTPVVMEIVRTVEIVIDYVYVVLYPGASPPSQPQPTPLKCCACDCECRQDMPPNDPHTNCASCDAGLHRLILEDVTHATPK